MRFVKYTVPGLLAAVATMSLWTVSAADPVAKASGPVKTANPGECYVCHSWDLVESETAPLRAFLDMPTNPSKHYVKLNESLTWQQKDPHSVPFNDLMKTTSGKAMIGNYNRQFNKRLEKDLEAKTITRIDQIDAVELKSCYACHTVVENEAPKERDDNGAVGIGCAGCHGGVGKEGDWQVDHWRLSGSGKSTAVEWREKDVKHKTDRGMKYLRDPQIKAAMCASCHIGDAGEHKVVTHKMYAMGHPPLPPFEMMTFQNGEPKHWYTPFDQDYDNENDPNISPRERELGKGAKAFFETIDKDKTKLNYGFYKNEGAQGYIARQILVSAIVSLKAEAELLTASAQRPEVTREGIDYARFDCYACHHNLTLPSDRQDRGYVGDPGRPPLKAWNHAMTRVVEDFAKETPFSSMASDVRAQLVKLMIAATKQPFGVPDAVVAEAKALSGKCQELLAKIDEQEIFDEKNVATFKKALHDLIDGKEFKGDAEAVMVMAWAYRALDAKGDWVAMDGSADLLPTVLRTPRPGTTKPVYAGETVKDRMDRFNKYKHELFTEKFFKKPSAGTR